MSKLTDFSGDRGKLGRVQWNAISFETKNKQKFYVRVSKVSGWNRVIVLWWSGHNTRPSNVRTVRTSNAYIVLCCSCRWFTTTEVKRTSDKPTRAYESNLETCDVSETRPPTVYNRGNAVTAHVFEFRLFDGSLKVSRRTTPLNSYAQWRRTRTSR